MSISKSLKIRGLTDRGSWLIWKKPFEIHFANDFTTKLKANSQV